MQALRICQQAGAGIAVRPLQLRIPQAAGVIDPEPFRVRALEGPALSESFARSNGMRTLHAEAQSQLDLFDLPGSLLTFVLTGAIEFSTGEGCVVTLAAGDIVLVEGDRPQSFSTRLIGETRLLQVMVADDWPGERTRPVRPRGDEQRPDGQPNFKRMYKGAKGRSHFRDFSALFAPMGDWSTLTPLIGIRFIGMAPDTFIDWHPEIVNNLVVVMTGGLELEVGGDPDSIEVFWPGDVCLAEDRTGEGHIDRMRGYVQVAVLIVADEDLW